MYGLSTVPFYLQKFLFIKSDLSKEVPYYFRIFPKIDSINTNKGFSSGGTELIIIGKGFKTDNIKIFIDEFECKNLKNISSSSVTCITESIDLDENKILFFGSNGLRIRRYDLDTTVTIANLNTLIEDGSVKPIYDDIILETSTKPTNQVNYGQLINGYFKAPFDGKYRFWSTSDDLNHVYLTYPDEENVIKKTKIIDFNGWTNFDDFFTSTEISRSSWISLKSGEYYPIDIYHLQYSGGDHFRMGVEISEFNNESGLDLIVNQANPIQSISLEVKYSRDLYEIPIETINPDDFVTIGCDTISVKIQISDTPVQFLNKIKTLNKNISSNLIIKKYAINEDNKYLSNEADPSQEYSYISDLSFDKMYLNINTDINEPVKGLTIENTGSKKGFSFLFFINKKKSERTFRLENTCYYITPGTTTKNSIIIKQYVSEEAEGTFAVNIKDVDNNKDYKTNFIDIKKEIGKLPEELNNIPFLINNHQFFWRSTGENINFFVRYPNNITIDGKTLLIKDVNHFTILNCFLNIIKTILFFYFYKLDENIKEILFN